jgi:hypothetical protein
MATLVLPRRREPFQEASIVGNGRQPSATEFGNGRRSSEGCSRPRPPAATHVIDAWLGAMAGPPSRRRERFGSAADAIE